MGRKVNSGEGAGAEGWAGEAGGRARLSGHCCHPQDGDRAGGRKHIYWLILVNS